MSVLALYMTFFLILRFRRLSNNLLIQGYIMERFRMSFRKFYGRYGNLSSNMKYTSQDRSHINVKWHSEARPVAPTFRPIRLNTDFIALIPSDIFNEVWEVSMGPLGLKCMPAGNAAFAIIVDTIFRQTSAVSRLFPLRLSFGAFSHLLSFIMLKLVRIIILLLLVQICWKRLGNIYRSCLEKSEWCR